MAESVQTKEVTAPMSFWDRLENNRPQGEEFDTYAGRVLMEAYDALRARSKA